MLQSFFLYKTSLLHKGAVSRDRKIFIRYTLKDILIIIYCITKL